jgi:hypothetical protein
LGVVQAGGGGRRSHAGVPPDSTASPVMQQIEADLELLLQVRQPAAGPCSWEVARTQAIWDVDARVPLLCAHAVAAVAATGAGPSSCWARPAVCCVLAQGG